MRVSRSEDGYTISGMEPVDFNRYSTDDRQMFYGWVVELGIRAKDRDLSKGLDKDGKPLRPIKPATRKHRVSAMTPSGKGDPNAPPLIPGWQKSRVRSLLTGKAFPDRAEFWWRYDAFTGDSFARVLEAQAAHGRDVFGLSPTSLQRVRTQAWERWNKWKRGQVIPATRKELAAAPIRAGSYETKYLDVMGHAEEIAKGQHAGFLTIEDYEKFFRQTAPARLVGRPLNPKVMSPISGPKYNRLIAQGLTFENKQPRGGIIPVRAPKPSPLTPVAMKIPGFGRKPKKQDEGITFIEDRFKSHAEVEAWARKMFPNATTVEVNGIPLDSWGAIADEIDFLSAKFPAEILERVKAFGSDDGAALGADGAIAWTNGNGNILRFDRKQWSKLAKLNKNFQSYVQTGWTPPKIEKAGAKYFVTHEFGHMVDFHTNRTDMVKHKALHDQFRTPNGYFDPLKGAEVSEYASTNQIEAAAEAFAAARWRTDQDNPIVNKFRQVYGL
jgi:hypothetical protein